MNVGSFGQNIKLIGLRHLLDQGENDSKRYWAQYEQDVAESKAKGQAIGSLIGTGVGLAKGAYDDYNQKETDADIERGVQARKEYGVLTDTNKPAMGRVREVYGDEVADVVAERTQLPVGLRQTMKDKGMLRGAKEMHDEMADLVALRPRISQTGNLLGGKDTQLVSNNPWRDFIAGSKYFDGLLDR